MKFKVSYSFPIIVIILALVSVFFLTKIQPFNLVIAAVVLVVAAVMVWRIYYDFSSLPKQQTQYVPSPNVNKLMKEAPKEEDGKMKLDDFLKSSPKDFSKEYDLDSKPKKADADPFSAGFSTDKKYNEMKKKALKELKQVIKPNNDSE